MKKLLVGVVLALSCLVTGARAAETKDRYAIRASDNMRTILESDVGIPVKLRLRSGSELSGTVVRVGNGIVQLGEISGMEFYDAIVNIDDISAVLVKVRKK